ncbi:MAG TPA: M23 family metallopeptidase [Bacillota bacterium]|nr:M23 family metallopeptidase [Bacillota bacterium]
MKEEQNGAPKNKWSRIFRKKWFFPAVYITVAAILLTVVVWYQNMDNQIPGAEDNQEASDHFTPDLYDEDAEAVMEQTENIKMPVNDQDKAEIVTKFYDATADLEDRENALVFHNNRYHQSTGVDITLGTDEPFDVVASLSGTVEEVKTDPALGNIVTLSHGEGVMTYYASMDDIALDTGDKVKQGDVLGTAGNNLVGKDIGPHVHFELRKSGEKLNPETYFNQSLTALDKVKGDKEDDGDGNNTEQPDPDNGDEVEEPEDVDGNDTETTPDDSDDNNDNGSDEPEQEQEQEQENE